MISRRGLTVSLWGALLRGAPVPKMQAVPMPGFQVSLERGGREVTRYHCHPEQRRPFLFPVIGPSGRYVTRMGHPHDPEGHSHHNSVWVSHHMVNGINFWGDPGTGGVGQIVHRRLEQLTDGMEEAGLVAHAEWVDTDTNRVLLRERRTVLVRDLGGGELLITLKLELQPAVSEVTFGKTPFGLIGVRVAKTMSVRDGGGVIRNSEGQEDEPQVLWQRAKWVDYSGQVADGVNEGITLLDHRGNPNHPTYFHVRRDGWMGASLSYDAPRKLVAGETLTLRYGLYVHAGIPKREDLEKRWAEFSR